MKKQINTQLRKLAGAGLLLLFVALSLASKGNTINITANTNWSAINTGSGPGGQPSAADNIFVSTTANATLTVDFGNATTTSTPVCSSITLGSTTANHIGTLTFTGTGHLTVSGTITFGTAGKGGAILTMISTATLECADFVVGKFNSYTSGGTIIFTGTNTIPTNFATFSALEIKSGTTTLGANTTVTALTVDNGATLSLGTTNFTLGIAGNLVNNGTIDGTSTGVITLSASGSTIDGTGTISNTGGISTNGAHTINSTADQTISGPGTFAITGPNTITNNGIINSSNTGGITGMVNSTWLQNASTAALTITGPFFTAAGTILTASASGNTVTYNGATGYVVKAATYSNLTIAAAGTSANMTATTVNGTLTLTSSILATNNTLTMASGSTLSRSAGSMTGTIQGAHRYNVTYTGSSAITTGPELTSHTVIINSKTSNTITLNAAITLDSLNLGSGTFAAGSNLTMTSGGNSAISASGGIMSGTPASSNIYDVIYTGAGQNTSTELAGSGLRNTTVNLTSGTVTLTSNATMSGNLALTAGILTLNGHNISAASTSGGSATSYIKCDNIATGATVTITSIGASNVKFPVGTSDYTPVTVNNIGTTQAFSVLVFDGVLQNGLTGGIETNIAHDVNKTWDVTNLGINPNITLTVQWNLADENTSFSRTNSYISHYNGSSWDMPTASAASGSNPYTQTRSGIGSFSPFAVGDDISPLPVQLISFNAKLQNKAVELIWATASEINNDFFTIERSADGIHFEDIMTKPGAGNSQTVSNYTAYDEQPLAGISYYRLKQTDFNGASQTFNMVSVDNNVSIQDFNIISAYPTLFSDHFTLNYKVPASGSVRMVVTDMSGAIIQDITLTANAGDNNLNISNTMGWRSGIYIVQLYYNNWVNYIKVSKSL